MEPGRPKSLIWGGGAEKDREIYDSVMATGVRIDRAVTAVERASETAGTADELLEARAAALRLSHDGRPSRSVRYRDFMQPQGYEDELRSVFRTGNST